MRPEDRRRADDSLDGYCAVAAGAYFFLSGGEDPRQGGDLQPMQLSLDHMRWSRLRREIDSHWWLLRKSDKRVIDLCVRPRERSDYPYAEGRRRAFMQYGYKRPSKRMKELMRRVEEALDG